MASSKAYSDDQSGPTKHRPRTSADVRGRPWLSVKLF